MSIRLTSIVLITYIFEFITSASVCPKYKCDSSLSNCATVLYDVVGGGINATLNGCTNDTFFCPLTAEKVALTARAGPAWAGVPADSTPRHEGEAHFWFLAWLSGC